MRSLIRPTLFAAARLGLFLAVTAWIVSQWKVAHGQVGPVRIEVHAQGGVTWIDRYDNIQPTVYFTQSSYGWPSSMYFEDTTNYGLGGEIFWNPIPGFVYSTHRGAGGVAKTFSMRHWLVTSLFAAFNIALHFIYRKRREEQSCEV